MLEGSEVNAARALDCAGGGNTSLSAAVPAQERRAVSSSAQPRRQPTWQGSIAQGSASGRGPVFCGRYSAALLPLHNAVLQGSLSLIEECVEGGASTVDAAGDSALSVAAAIGRCNAASALLAVPECRALLNRTNEAGHTALELSLLRGHWKMAELLIEAGGTF